MAEQKRRWGDRRDATLLRDTDALHFIMGIIYPNRADNEAYIAERVNLEPIKAYIAEKNYEGIPFKYTFFHVILTALAKTVVLRPKLNRFYANENLLPAQQGDGWLCHQEGVCRRQRRGDGPAGDKA